ncbi:MAG: amidase [Hyphomicrobiales bacterium]|nr:amidase [Hyphomicrobiales bacterium]
MKLEPAYQSATELCSALAAGTISSVELLEHYRARYERLNRPVNAIIATDFEVAGKRARACDEALARGKKIGPLHGLPMTIKDSFEVVGMPTTSGARELVEYMPTANAVAVQRLVDAGAVVFGKTNLPRFATGFESYNDVHGTTNNPWDLARTCGGSSGGPAAAVAAGLTGLDIGSDIGGSVRVPAHFCGLYAHKPSLGIVPLRGHIPGPPGTLALADMVVAGPLARGADDLSLVLGVLAGPDIPDAGGWELSLPPARHGSLKDFRVAAWLDDATGPVDGEVLQRLEAAVALLEQAGVTVDRKARPDIDMKAAFAAYLSMLSALLGTGLSEAEFVQMIDAQGDIAPEDMSIASVWRRGLVLRHRDWLSARELRAQVRQAWSDFFRRYDVLLSPPMGTVAFPHDQGPDFTTQSIKINGERRPYLEQLFWPALCNFGFLPAAVSPVGRAQNGLPVGIQIVADYLDDFTAIEFSRLTQNIWGGFVPPPEMV